MFTLPYPAASIPDDLRASATSRSSVPLMLQWNAFQLLQPGASAAQSEGSPPGASGGMSVAVCMPARSLTHWRHVGGAVLQRLRWGWQQF